MVENTDGGRGRTCRARRALGLAALLAVAGSVAAPALAAGGDVPGVIVKLRAAAPYAAGRETAQVARERLGRAFQGAPIPLGLARPLGEGAHVVRWSRPLAAGESAKLIAALRTRADVEWAVPNLREPLLQSVTPNDPRYAVDQWWLSAGATDAGSAGVPAIATAWTTASGGDVAIAILDSGLRRSHPDLSGSRFAAGYDLVTDEDGLAADGDGRDADFDDPGDGVAAGECGGGTEAQASTWHGTFIAGQIGALTGNGIGVAGVNRQAKVLSVRVASKCGALVSDIVDGMRWAAGLPVDGVPTNASPARVVNISFGSANTDCTPYQDTIDLLRSRGVLVVAAAGNSTSIVHRPARCEGVLAVGAVNRRGFKTDYSNAGTQVGLSTVGGDLGGTLGDRGLMSTSNAGTQAAGVDGYEFKSGTSFSAPIVSAVATLMLTVNPDLTVAQLENGLKDTARPHVTGVAGLEQCTPDIAQGRCLCTGTTCGAGLLDAPAALAWAADAPSSPSSGGGGSGGGGGGGAMGIGWLLGLAAAVGLLAGGRARRPA